MKGDHSVNFFISPSLHLILSTADFQLFFPVVCFSRSKAERMAGFMFHVEFGMNETPITHALEQNDWPSAERLIRECQNGSFLDDGWLKLF